jgi:hypothetical protein
LSKGLDDIYAAQAPAIDAARKYIRLAASTQIFLSPGCRKAIP